jgi:hypothetical protein
MMQRLHTDLLDGEQELLRTLGGASRSGGFVPLATVALPDHLANVAADSSSTPGGLTYGRPHPAAVLDRRGCRVGDPRRAQAGLVAVGHLARPGRNDGVAGRGNGTGDQTRDRRDRRDDHHRPKDNPADLISVALEDLVRARCEVPGFSTLAASIRAEVNTALFGLVSGRVGVARPRLNRLRWWTR